MCWKDVSEPLPVENISITLNLKQPEGDIVAQDVPVEQSGNAAWVLPQDDSIDLAVLPLAPNQVKFDYWTVPVAMLADDLSETGVTEGQPVFFAGFFSQFPGIKRMEPILRQGAIAMMPDEKIPFKKLPERVYLTDVHVFHGNSGSPVFMDLRRNLGTPGEIDVLGDYRVLGVVNAEVTEDENFNLEMTTTIRGTVAENSGVSTVVPAFELKALLDDPRLQALRDEIVKGAGTQRQ